MERPVPLTPRETQVLQQVLLGKTNKQIALALDISERTVEYHLKNIYAKHGVSSRIELVLKLGNATGRSGHPTLGGSAVEMSASLRENGSRDSSIVDDLALIAKEPEMKRRWTFYGLAGLLFGAAYWHYFSLTARLFNELETAGGETAQGWLLILALLTDFGVWLIPAVLPALIESRRSPSVRLSVLAVVTVWLGAVLGYYLNYLAMLAFVGLPHMEYLLLFGQRTASFWEAWPKVVMKLIVLNYLKWTLVGSVISAIAGLRRGSAGRMTRLLAKA
jgi:DNA-binding CsgD family transcriptional regulator